MLFFAERCSGGQSFWKEAAKTKEKVRHGKKVQKVIKRGCMREPQGGSQDMVH